jgi:hypothetical protein
LHATPVHASLYKITVTQFIPNPYAKP